METKTELDYRNFNADAELAKIKQKVKKPNLFLCGATGVGKSSLVADIFNYSMKDAPKSGEGVPVTHGVHRYESSDLGIVLHDSEGYEIGSERQKHYYSDVIGYIDECNRSTDLNTMDSRIHEVWYCVSAGTKRFTDTDEGIVRCLLEKKLPVCIIINKIDEAGEDELNDLKSVINSKLPELNIFTYSSHPISPENCNSTEQYNMRMSSYNAIKEAGYIQKDELIHWANQNLDASLRTGLLSSVKGSLSEKHDHVRKVIVPMYAAGAIAAVVGNAFVPVPFTDSVFLMGLQTSMAIHILHVYNFESIGDAVSSVIGSTVISTIGKTIAGSIIKVIPGIGAAASIAVNSTVAATLTGSIGYAIEELSYKYMVSCVDNNGKAKIPFGDYFTPETFKAAFEAVNEKYGDKFKEMAEQFLRKEK